MLCTEQKFPHKISTQGKLNVQYKQDNYKDRQTDRLIEGGRTFDDRNTNATHTCKQR